MKTRKQMAEEIVLHHNNLEAAIWHLEYALTKRNRAQSTSAIVEAIESIAIARSYLFELARPFLDAEMLSRIPTRIGLTKEGLERVLAALHEASDEYYNAAEKQTCINAALNVLESVRK